MIRGYFFKILLTLAFLVLGSGVALANEAKKEPLRIFGYGPQITVLLELLYSEGIVGLNYEPYPEDKPFMPSNIAKLPVLGGTGNTEVAFEKLVALKPNVIFFSKNAPSRLVDPYTKLGIKTVRIETWDTTHLSESIRIIGETLGVQERAAKLNEFLKRSSDMITQRQSKITKRPSIYFALGNDGLQTSCFNPSNKEDLAHKIGGVNAINCSSLTGKYGFGNVNFETLLKVDPDIIFVREGFLYREFLNNPKKQWQALSAIKHKRIYYAPSTPSNWLTKPPSVMQTIGIPWAFSKVQPDLLTNTEAKDFAQEFFETFLKELSDSEYERIQQE